MELKGKRAAILVEQQYQEMEIWYPLYRLREAGYATHAVPTVVLEPVDPWLALRPALAELGLLDWLVITSPNGAVSASISARRT